MTADFTSDDNFSNILEYNANINIKEISDSNTRYGNIQSKRSKQVDSETLSKRWKIDLGKANNTETRTTHCRVKICLHPMMGLQYPMNDQMLRYKRIPDPVFSDTLKVGNKYKRGNVYGQAYCTSYGWRYCNHMQKKSEAHDTLFIIFKRDGVPPKMVVENSKE